MSLRTLFGCDFGLHRWSKWTDGDRYRVRIKITDVCAGLHDTPYWIEVGEELMQTRTCEVCGVKRTRSVRI